MAVARDRRKRAAGADHGAPFGPGERDPRASLRCVRSGWTAERSPAAARASPSSRTTASENACACPDVPISTVGCALPTTSARPIRSGRFQRPRGDAIAALSERAPETAGNRSCPPSAGLPDQPDKSGRGHHSPLTPASTMARSNSAQIPVPAEPAPSTAMR